MANNEWGGTNEELHSGTFFRHFCFEVIGLEDFCENIKLKKYEVSEITVGKDFSKQAWISDPDGNLIELMEYTNKSEQLGSGSMSLKEHNS